MFGGQILVFGRKTRREDESGIVRTQNINAARMIAEVVRTNLGPSAMLKMLMDPMGGVVMTNDGNAILREIIVQHPVAKMMIEIARTQDEEVGDGTTSVIILCGQILSEVERFIGSYHPSIIIRELRQALDDILTFMPEISKSVDTKNHEEMLNLIKASLGTKFLGTSWSRMACEMALKAVNIVKESSGKDRERIDIKSFARVEKVPGGSMEESHVLEGVMINKDILHPEMKRLILNPRILLLNSALEYKKGESMTNAEMVKEGDFTRLLQIEEEFIVNQCNKIIALKPDLVITEKGMSDLAIHHFAKAKISALRRVKKMDMVRISRATGATLMSRIEEISEQHLGTRAGRFEVILIGDEYFSFINDCKDTKACTIVLRGPSKDIIHEVERNLQDAMNVARNLYMEPSVVPGGGAVEMKLFAKIISSKSGLETEGSPYSTVPAALKIIPQTLLENSGASVMHSMSKLESAHLKGEMLAVDGVTGDLVAAEELGIWEPTRVKTQIYKTAIETAVHILKIDEIVSGSKSKSAQSLDKVEKKQKGEPVNMAGQGDQKEF
ncbi:unnamed protein product [Nezara viridula]|uniref:T-complex protein 1 subunit gamma n=1 Tax=Nezara viridula TaxID=85310 RepID=A0A9P0HU98_NEZVI|nr:unnamed protein product [Nezara viridula]